MSYFDIENMRAEIRAMDFVRWTPEQEEIWRDDSEESRANLVIESMISTPSEDAVLELMLDEAMPPQLAAQILLWLRDYPNADWYMPNPPVTGSR